MVKATGATGKNAPQAKDGTMWATKETIMLGYSSQDKKNPWVHADIKSNWIIEEHRQFFLQILLILTELINVGGWGKQKIAIRTKFEEKQDICIVSNYFPQQLVITKGETVTSQCRPSSCLLLHVVKVSLASSETSCHSVLRIRGTERARESAVFLRRCRTSP